MDGQESVHVFYFVRFFFVLKEKRVQKNSGFSESFVKREKKLLFVQTKTSAKREIQVAWIVVVAIIKPGFKSVKYFAANRAVLLSISKKSL